MAKIGCFLVACMRLYKPLYRSVRLLLIARSTRLMAIGLVLNVDTAIVTFQISLLYLSMLLLLLLLLLLFLLLSSSSLSSYIFHKTPFTRRSSNFSACSCSREEMSTFAGIKKTRSRLWQNVCSRLSNVGDDAF